MLTSGGNALLIEVEASSNNDPFGEDETADFKKKPAFGTKRCRVPHSCLLGERDGERRLCSSTHVAAPRTDQGSGFPQNASARVRALEHHLTVVRLRQVVPTITVTSGATGQLVWTPTPDQENSPQDRRRRNDRSHEEQYTQGPDILTGIDGSISV